MRHHGLIHPARPGEADVVAFLRHLAADQHVAQSTQAQALAALQFLYRHVIERPLRLEGRLPRARTPTRLPVVLTRNDCWSRAMTSGRCRNRWVIATGPRRWCIRTFSIEAALVFAVRRTR